MSGRQGICEDCGRLTTVWSTQRHNGYRNVPLCRTCRKIEREKYGNSHKAWG